MINNLYDRGQVVFYYDPWFEECGVGLILYVEDIRPTHISYCVYAPNSNLSVGEYDNPHFINLNARDVAPIDEYKNFEEFLKSRGFT